MKLEFTLQAAAGSNIGPDGKKNIQYICIYIYIKKFIHSTYVYIYTLIGTIWGVEQMEGWNSSFRIGAAAQDPEDDDWKQRPRYVCPRKVCCFFSGDFNRREHFKKRGWISVKYTST